MLLGVNVDHVATLRQARGTDYPDPVEAALLAERSGADSITVHLREDRRHIQDHDVARLMDALQIRLNLEMAMTAEMVAIAAGLRPADCCLVPEKRAELTTEGGLDVLAQSDEIAAACGKLSDAHIRVSLFIDPEPSQIDAALACGAQAIELHTGTFADTTEPVDRNSELMRIKAAAEYADRKGLIVNAGHGLHYGNVAEIAAIPQIVELNIGHSMIAQAVFDGLGDVVAEMKRRMHAARPV